MMLGTTNIKSITRITLVTGTETELYSVKEIRNRMKPKTITNNCKAIVFVSNFWLYD